MSGDGGGPKNGGGKTLLPELLPVPTPEAASGAKERVNERARLLLARFRELGVTGVAILSLQCAEGRLGPGGRVPGTGGAGGSGGLTGNAGAGGGGGGVAGNAGTGGGGVTGSGGSRVDGRAADAPLPPDVGYTVVDPAPPPAYAQCPAVADPFGAIKASAKVASAAPEAQVWLYLSAPVIDLRADNVRVTGGRVIRLDATQAVNRYNPYTVITLAPDAAPTAPMVATIDLSCGTKKTTKSYQIDYHADAPAGGAIPVAELR